MYNGLSICMCVYHVCAWCLGKPEKRIGFSEIGVADD